MYLGNSMQNIISYECLFTKVTKSLGSHIDCTLVDIFNFLVETKTFPFNLKINNVIPMQLKYILLSLNNYRPIEIYCKFTPGQPLLARFDFDI